MPMRFALRPFGLGILLAVSASAQTPQPSVPKSGEDRSPAVRHNRYPVIVLDSATRASLVAVELHDLLAEHFGDSITIKKGVVFTQNDTAAIEARKLGYAPFLGALVPSADDTVRVFLARNPQYLPEIEVREKSDMRGFTGFGARCNTYQAGGTCYNPEYLAKHPAFSLGDIVRRASGVHAVCSTPMDCRVSMRPSAGPGRCSPLVFVDGFLWTGMRKPAFTEVNEHFSPRDIRAIEVYQADMSMPLTFSGLCGAIAIWTK